ncbi:MAG: helix-turn-helix domain-containing protein [Candidatus Puniceispirillales bacterium WSBS_2018_MAG_OTU23]
MENLNIKPIKDTADHDWAMQQIDEIMSQDNISSNQVERMEVLAILVEKYEKEHFPVKSPTPVEAIEFRIDQLAITRSQASEILGVPRSRVSEVLNGKRPPSLNMMRSLHKLLNIPADVLLNR